MQKKMENINNRQLITSIRVRNPLKVAAEKDNETIRAELESIYLNRCHKGVFVQKINKIITHSDITLSRFNLDAAGGNMTVVFEVNVIQINTGDVVLARVERINNISYILFSDNEAISIIVEDLEPPIKLAIGDYALVVIKDYVSDTGQPRIKARASWFEQIQPVIFKCVGPSIDVSKIIMPAPTKKITFPGESEIPSVAKLLKTVSEGNWGFWFKGDGTIMYASVEAAVPTSTEISTATLVSMYYNFMDTAARVSVKMDSTPIISEWLQSK